MDSSSEWIQQSHHARPSMDLIPAHRSADLQVILRTRDHAAFYDPSSNALSMQSRFHTSHNHVNALSLQRPSSSSLPLQDQRAIKLSSSDAEQNLSLLGRHAFCPTCFRPWAFDSSFADTRSSDVNRSDDLIESDQPSYVAPNYFRLLAQASSFPGSSQNTRPSSPNTLSEHFANTGNNLADSARRATSSYSSTANPGPYPPAQSSNHASASQPLQQGSEADEYYSKFFVEIKKLGRGARGQVFLCQHVLNGNRLGKYAIKKIPVGDHAESLLKSLNEVHVMESLHHPHLIHYQHAWIESCQLSPFAPRVPTLHVLMMAANGGSLDDWISARSGEAVNDSPRPSNRGGSPSPPANPSNDQAHDSTQSGFTSPPANRTKVERLKAALRQRRANRECAAVASGQDPSPSANLNSSRFGFPDPTRARVGVHLLREEEIYSLLHDMTSGLGFLHDRGILHLDIKPGNVLLHWDEDSLIPRAMLSDFGSSTLLHDNWTRQRSGHTGTMEYMSPETLITDPITGKFQVLSTKADIWSMGMILHLLLFFALPYSQVDDVDVLRQEMLAYRGFNRSVFDSAGGRSGVRRSRSSRLLNLLERMLDLDPSKRPSCKVILDYISSGPEQSASEPSNASLALYPRNLMASASVSTASTDWDSATETNSVHEDADTFTQELPSTLKKRPRSKSAATPFRSRRFSSHEPESNGVTDDLRGRIGVGAGVEVGSSSINLSRRLLEQPSHAKDGFKTTFGRAASRVISRMTGVDMNPLAIHSILAVMLVLIKTGTTDMVCSVRGMQPSLWLSYLSLCLALIDLLRSILDPSINANTTDHIYLRRQSSITRFGFRLIRVVSVSPELTFLVLHVALLLVPGSCRPVIPF